MASYVNKILIPGEKVVYIGYYHWLSRISAYLLCLVLIGLFLLVMMRSTEMAVTSQRLIYKRGWISRKTEEMSLRRIEEVNLRQGMIGRMLGYGKLQVQGTGGGSIKLPVMGNPVRFKQELDLARMPSE